MNFPSHRVNWEESIAASNESEEFVKDERDNYILIYTCLIVIGIVLLIIRAFSFFRMCLRISINMHDMIFRSISRAKMLFFNNNPSGRVLNRFSRDMFNVDTLLPNITNDVLTVSV